MSENDIPEELSVEELEKLLYLKRRSERQKRLARLKDEGRLVELEEQRAINARANHSEESEEILEADLPQPEPLEEQEDDGTSPSEEESQPGAPFQWRWLANNMLLVVEVATVVGLIVLVLYLWQTTQNLNEEIAEIQAAQSQSLALPTPTATAVIGVAVLPSGHKPPINGRPPEPGEAGDIPSHLLPIIDSYIPPPIPTPGPEQARRIEIPSLDVDKPIVQGDDWEQLKKGVGQHVGTTLPGREGNLVLSAHNDIYGEIFRNLDKLAPGDEIIISTERQSYVYVVNDIQVVEPTDVWVMGPTEHAGTTLISCYPYLVNNKRIVVFADLAQNLRASNS